MSHDPEAIYRAVFESSPDGILLVDEMGTIVDVNPRIRELFGYEEEELVGQPVELLVPTDVRGGHQRHRNHYLDDPHARPMGIGMELRAERKDGSTFPVEVSLSPLPLGGELSVVATLRDLTQRKRLRDFGAGALRASEEERQRIARELHDDTAQHLSTLLIRLRLLGRTDDAETWEENLASFRDELRSVAEGVRRIARGLRPPELEDAGLIPALRAHLRSIQEGTGLQVILDADPVGELLDSERKLVLYRIVQEAVSNANRHAEATHVRVRLAREGRNVVAEIEDDGKGFLPSRVQNGTDPGGLGLLGMQERATMAGGRLLLESRPGEGTQVRVRIPIEIHGEKDDA